MELWAHFPKHPSKDYRIVTGASFTDRLNETLDEGDIILAHVKKEDVFDIKPMDDVIIYSDNEKEYFSEETGRGKNGLPNREYGKMYQGIWRFIDSPDENRRVRGMSMNNFCYLEEPGTGRFHSIFYAHMVVWDISEDPINIGVDYFNFHIKLMSETKVLENFLIPNRTVRQPQRSSSENKRKIIALPDPNSTTVAGRAGGVINELISYYAKPKMMDSTSYHGQVDKTALQIALDPELYDLFKGEDGQPLICPEMHFPAGTLRSALAQIFYVVDCIPVVHDGVLTYMKISEKGIQIDSDFRRRSWKTSQMSGGEYADRLRRTYSNSLSQGTTTRFVERMGFRNSDEALMTLGNMRLEFAHPIYKINKLLLCFYREKGAYSDYRIKDGAVTTQQFTGTGTQTDFTFGTPIGDTVTLSSGTTTDYASGNGQWHNKIVSIDETDKSVDIEFDNPPSNGVSFDVVIKPVGLSKIYYRNVGDGAQKIFRIYTGASGPTWAIIKAYLTSLGNGPVEIELPFDVAERPNSHNGMISFAYPPSSGVSFTVSYQKMSNMESGYGVDYISGGTNFPVKLSSCDVVKYDMTKLVLQNAVRNILSEDWQQLNVVLNNLSSGKYTISDLARFKMCTVGFDIGSKYVTGWGSLYEWMEAIYNPQASYIENIIAILTAMYPGGTDSWDAKNFRDGDIYQIEGNDYLVDKPTGKIINTNIASIIPPAVYNSGVVDWVVDIVQRITAVGTSDGSQTLRMKGVFFECEYEGFVEGAVEYTKDEHDGIVMKDDSQSAAFTYTSADGVQEKGKINRLGNKTVTMAARYSNMLDANGPYWLGDYDEDNNIVYQRTFAVFKDYAAVSYIMCKDYIIRNYFTSVWSKKRPYGLASYGEAVKRNEIEHVQIIISPDQQYNWDLPFTFDVFNEAKFVGDYLLSFWKGNYDWNDYGKQDKTTLSSSLLAHDGARYILEAQPFIAGSAYCVTVAMTDNVSAGQYIRRFAPSVSGYGKAVWNRKADKYEPASEDDRFGDLSIFDDLTGSVMNWYNTASETETGFSLSNNFCLFGVNQTEKEKATRFLPSVLSVSDGVYRNDLLPLPKMPNWMADQSDNTLKPAAFDYHLHTKTYMKDGQETLLDTFEFEPIKTKGMAFSKYFMLLSDLNDYYMKITLDTPTGQLDAPLFISMASLTAPAATEYTGETFTNTVYRMSVSYDSNHISSIIPYAYGIIQSYNYLYKVGMSNDPNDWNTATSSQTNPLVIKQDITQQTNQINLRIGNALLLAWYLPVSMMDFTPGSRIDIQNPQAIEFAYRDDKNNWIHDPALSYLSITPKRYKILKMTEDGKDYYQVRLDCEVATLFRGDYSDILGTKLCGWLDKGMGNTYLYIDHTYETYQDMMDNYASDGVQADDIIYVKHDEEYASSHSYAHAYPGFYKYVSGSTFTYMGGAMVTQEGVTLFSNDTFKTNWATGFNSPGENSETSNAYTATDGPLVNKYITNVSVDKDLVLFSGAYTSVTTQCWFNGSPVAFANGDTSVKIHYLRAPIMATNGVGWYDCFYPISNGKVNKGRYQKKVTDYQVEAAPINDKVNLVWRICPSIGDNFNPDACIIDIDNANFFAPSSFTSPTFDESNKTFSFSFTASKSISAISTQTRLRNKSIRCYYYDDNDHLWHFVIGFNLSKGAKFVSSMADGETVTTVNIQAFVSVLQTRENRVFDSSTGDMVGKLVNFADKGTGLNLIPTSEHAWWSEDGTADIPASDITLSALLSDSQQEGMLGRTSKVKLRPIINYGSNALKYKIDVSVGDGSSATASFPATVGMFLDSDNLATDGTITLRSTLIIGNTPPLSYNGNVTITFSIVDGNDTITKTATFPIRAHWSATNRCHWSIE